LGSRDDQVLSGKLQGLAATPDAACPNACPSEPENGDGIDLERLADELRAMLSKDECRWLADLLNEAASGPMGDA